ELHVARLCREQLVVDYEQEMWVNLDSSISALCTITASGNRLKYTSVPSPSVAPPSE
ncbi:hypothetical protein KUCAC02_030486, partial [Chaenocephalus aceratus]